MSLQIKYTLVWTKIFDPVNGYLNKKIYINLSNRFNNLAESFININLIYF